MFFPVRKVAFIFSSFVYSNLKQVWSVYARINTIETNHVIKKNNTNARTTNHLCISGNTGNQFQTERTAHIEPGTKYLPLWTLEFVAIRVSSSTVIDKSSLFVQCVSPYWAGFRRMSHSASVQAAVLYSSILKCYSLTFNWIFSVISVL